MIHSERRDDSVPVRPGMYTAGAICDSDLIRDAIQHGVAKALQRCERRALRAAINRSGRAQSVTREH